jgi:hypothetical protein
VGDVPLRTDQYHKCPDCKNQFVQPFVCTTCGAQKLYDETVRSQGRTIMHLRAALDDLVGQVSRFCAEHGEGEFYTGPAKAALGQSKAPVHVADLRRLAEGLMANG